MRGVDGHHGPLITWTSGPEDAPPVLLLHDRYGDYDSLDQLASELTSSHRVVRVRGARTQMEDTGIKGYFWFIGPYDRPELSTFGDALHHLENLLTFTRKAAGDRRATLIGQGEGGVMALMLAMIWRDALAGVVSIGGPLPQTLDELPVTTVPQDGLPVLLLDQAHALDGTATELVSRGARVELKHAVADPMGVALRWVQALPASG